MIISGKFLKTVPFGHFQLMVTKSVQITRSPMYSYCSDRCMCTEMLATCFKDSFRRYKFSIYEDVLKDTDKMCIYTSGIKHLHII